MLTSFFIACNIALIDKQDNVDMKTLNLDKLICDDVFFDEVTGFFVAVDGEDGYIKVSADFNISYEDTSFDHEFGTEHGCQMVVTATINNVEYVDWEYDKLSEDYLLGLFDDYVYKNEHQLEGIFG